MSNYSFFKRASQGTVLLAILVYATGMFLTLMEPDATSYALVSKEMYDSGDFASITLRGQDWLDKPHFQFWVTAISYRIFGVNNFAYRLPSLLIFLLGVWYTYRYALKFYNRETAWVAVILLMTALHIIISNSDVRAEAILLGFTIFSLYHAACYMEHKRWGDLVLGCLGLAILLMTKGLFTIIPVGAGIGLTLIYQQKWREIFHWQWIVVLVLTLFFTLPTLIAYYIQFDLHPEKEVFGRTGVSGVQFFLWESQWGRFTNSGPIKGQSELLFFVHTMLWAFAPWALLAYYALFQKVKKLFQRNSQTEHYTFFGFITLFLIFSVSKFQLPHYLNNIYPLLAIFTADAILKIKARPASLTFNFLQALQIVLFLVALGVLHYFFTASFMSPETILLYVLSWGLLIYFYFGANRYDFPKWLFPSALAILTVGYYLNREFYPRLMPYQSETKLAYYLKETQPDGALGTYQVIERSVDFYYGETLGNWSLEFLQKPYPEDRFVFTTSSGLADIKEGNIDYEIVHTFTDFHITTLKPRFINRFTRREALKKTYLLKIEGSKENLPGS